MYFLFNLVANDGYISYYEAQEIKEHMEMLPPANQYPTNSTTGNARANSPSQMSSLGTTVNKLILQQIQNLTH